MEKDVEWRCCLYGDVAELVSSDAVAEWTDDGVTTPLVQSYKAPAGYAFRKLNVVGTQARCDLSGEP